MRAALATCVLALLPWGGLAAEHGGWQVGRADIRIVCPMTVGGSFEARTSSLAGSLTLAQSGVPILTGSLSVDLKTLDTGIDLRNEHLRRKYLEVDSGAGFDKAVMSDIHLGTIDLDSFEGRTDFTGALLLHGAKRVIAGQAVLRRSPSGLQVEASFPVTLADFNIPKPQYLGVGVKSRVQVKVAFVAVALDQK